MTINLYTKKRNLPAAISEIIFPIYQLNYIIIATIGVGDFYLFSVGFTIYQFCK